MSWTYALSNRCLLDPYRSSCRSVTPTPLAGETLIFEAGCVKRQQNLENILTSFFAIGMKLTFENLNLTLFSQVSLKFNAEEVKPGDDVSLELRADPGSLAATLVVDKSVILLKSGFDLSYTEVGRYKALLPPWA